MSIFEGTGQKLFEKEGLGEGVLGVSSRAAKRVGRHRFKFNTILFFSIRNKEREDEDL